MVQIKFLFHTGKLNMKARIKLANNLVKTDDGLHEGFITAAQFGIGKRQEKHGRDVEEIEYQRFELIVNFDGTNSPIQVKTYTGATINDEPLETRYAGRGAKNEVKIYNRFTTLLLKLGILNEDELKTVNDDTIDEIEKKIDALNGRYIRCAVGKNKDGFYAIDVETIELSDEKKTEK